MNTERLTLHHLANSQSERIVWLCEELELDYCLRRYARRPDNRLAPEEYSSLHPMGTSPVVTDGPILLAESGAVVSSSIASTGGSDRVGVFRCLIGTLPSPRSARADAPQRACALRGDASLVQTNRVNEPSVSRCRYPRIHQFCLDPVESRL